MTVSASNFYPGISCDTRQEKTDFFNCGCFGILEQNWDLHVQSYSALGLNGELMISRFVKKRFS